MHYLLVTLIFWISKIAGFALEDTNSTLVNCGTQTPPAALLDMAMSMANWTSKAATVDTNRALEINLYFHLVVSETKEGAVTGQMLEDQLDVLNMDFIPHGITFKLIKTLYHYDDDWATGVDELEMKTAVRQGTYADLNIYYVSDLFETTGSLLGYCNFPGSTSADSSIVILDGCVVDTGTLPGGSLAPYNVGSTSTHEVGHWFGLFHVFQGESCSGSGDLVSDTPQQAVVTRGGCPTSQDSCQDLEGLDNIYNYMDYSLDGCADMFTEGQKARMYQMWDEYRAAHQDDN